jgi:hypothetical protein
LFFPVGGTFDAAKIGAAKYFRQFFSEKFLLKKALR